jgi:glycosyltransferase involved in cell wall biosynthesis
MTQSLPRISIVIPVYNSEAILPDLIRRIQSVIPGISSSYEVILVNDGSWDGSWDVIDSIARDHEWVHGINLMRNYGQHNALLCGIRAAKNEIIVTMDDDLQHPPEEVPKLLATLEEGYDVVYGTPTKEQHGLWRDLASQVTKHVIQSTMGIENARNISSFRIFRAEIRNAFNSYESPSVLLDVLLTWGTTRFKSIPVNHKPRLEGDSNYTLYKLAVHAINMVTGFSILPLQLASLTGFFLALFGAGVLFYVLGQYIIYGSIVPGFTFLASLIAMFSGAQLFAIGIIGEYIARMHFRMMGRPQYVIRGDSTTMHEKLQTKSH